MLGSERQTRQRSVQRRVLGAVDELDAPSERRQLESVHDRVLTVIKWILVEISSHSIQGRLLIAPPILSRVYQELRLGRSPKGVRGSGRKITQGGASKHLDE